MGLFDFLKPKNTPEPPKPPAAGTNVRHVYPLIVPAGYLATGWQLPHYEFPIAGFILTWVQFEGSAPMIYLTKADCRELEANFDNWEQRSFENLRHSGNNFHTHVKFRGETNHRLYLTFLNTDGIGSSRILFNVELAKGFPKGYYVAFPDRSCGMVISKDITEEELNEIRSMVKEMFEEATTPMSGDLFEPESFALPSEWTLPIIPEFSEQIVEVIWKG